MWDSGDALERTVAAANPGAFNVVDGRSGNRGPEPEGAAGGRVGGCTYAFVGPGRTGGFMVIDVTDPYAARVVNWVNNRDDATDPAGPDRGPEMTRFVPAAGTGAAR